MLAEYSPEFSSNLYQYDLYEYRNARQRLTTGHLLSHHNRAYLKVVELNTLSAENENYLG
jgi:hypothetical protein